MEYENNVLEIQHRVCRLLALFPLTVESNVAPLVQGSRAEASLTWNEWRTNSLNNNFARVSSVNLFFKL